MQGIGIRGDGNDGEIGTPFVFVSISKRIRQNGTVKFNGTNVKGSGGFATDEPPSKFATERVPLTDAVSKNECRRSRCRVMRGTPAPKKKASPGQWRLVGSAPSSDGLVGSRLRAREAERDRQQH